MKMKMDYKFILLLGVLFASAWIFGGKIFYSMFFAALGMLIFALIYGIASWRKIKLMVSIEDDICSVGKSVNTRYTVVNNSGFKMLNLSLEFGHENILEDNKKKRFFLNADNSKNILEKHTFMFRGGYDFVETSLVIRDPFGFSSVDKRIKGDEKIEVYPRVYKIKRNVQVESHYFDADDVNREGSEDKRFTKDIRRYNQGDDIKKIHWKVSAKVDRLMVKNCEKVTGSKGFIFVDMNENNMQEKYMEEEMIDFAASLIYEFMGKKIKHNVLLNDAVGEERYIEGEYGFFEVFDYLKNTKSDGKEEICDFLRNNISKVPQGSWIGIITMNLTREMVEYVISLIDNGFKITLFHNEVAENYKKVLNDYNVKTLNYVEVEKENIRIGS